jgi:hypothetical protein
MKHRLENDSYTDSASRSNLENRAVNPEYRRGDVAAGYAAAADLTGAYPTVQHAGAQFDPAGYAAAQHAAYYMAGTGRHAAAGPYAGTGGHAAAGGYPEPGDFAPGGGYAGTGGYGVTGGFGEQAGYQHAGYGVTGGFPQQAGYPPAGYAVTGGFPGQAGYPPAGYGVTGGYPEYDTPAGYPGTGAYDGAAGLAGAAEAAAGDAERTEVLINRGRRNVRQAGPARWLAHWRAVAFSVAAVAFGATLLAVLLPGASPTWPASVAQVQSEITVACQNPNVVSEPSQVNFACAKGTQQILWVFSLLTSGDNPGFTDSSSGRKGLEPISPAQGGDVAWSLNLHHPYNPASPTDSLEVAARAINDIIGGATLTGSSGSPEVQPGLESSPANCQRYTGSSALITRQGFPAVCALPVSSPGGQAALVSDVFQQWMIGTPSRIATEAGVLFENADNPGDSRVQAILNSLPQTGL